MIPFDVLDSQAGSPANLIFDYAQDDVLMLFSSPTAAAAAARHSRTRRRLEAACHHCTAEVLASTVRGCRMLRAGGATNGQNRLQAAVGAVVECQVPH